MQYQSNDINFHTNQSISRCCLQNVGHSVSASVKRESTRDDLVHVVAARLSETQRLGPRVPKIQWGPCVPEGSTPKLENLSVLYFHGGTLQNVPGANENLHVEGPGLSTNNVYREF